VLEINKDKVEGFLSLGQEKRWSSICECHLIFVKSGSKFSSASVLSLNISLNNSMISDPN